MPVSTPSLPPTRTLPPATDPMPIPRGVYVVESPTHGTEILAVMSDGFLAMPPFLIELPDAEAVARRERYIASAVKAATWLLDGTDPVT